jgi:transcriptional antiterminator RfaH
MSEKKWYAVYTRPRFEKKVEKYLKDRNIECYLPLQKTLRQWSDRKKMVELPLFSSYIFVKTGTVDYLTVLNAPGAVRYISFDGSAVEIPVNQIEKIRWILSSDISCEVLEENIPEGSRVEIIKGPLLGLQAEMIDYKNKYRILVRLEQLDKSFEIQVPASHVKVLTA